MENQVIPTDIGQVCKTVKPLENERQDDVYIITEDPALFDDSDAIEIVRLKDLQKNINDPSKAERKQVTKSNLTVVGRNLEDYISTWNN